MTKIDRKADAKLQDLWHRFDRIAANRWKPLVNTPTYVHLQTVARISGKVGEQGTITDSEIAQLAAAITAIEAAVKETPWQ